MFEFQEKIFQKNEKFFENRQDIARIFFLTQKDTQLSKKTKQLQKKNFDRRKVFSQNHQNIMKIVFLGPKATQL